MEERWRGRVWPVLAEFQTFLSDKVPPLEIVQAVDRTWSDDDYKRLRPDGFPSRLRGVYLIFDPESVLQYVGLAMWSFDNRVWSHDEYVTRRWTDVIPFDDRRIFLAPALEFYMISQLKPPANKQYRDYDLPSE